MQRMTTALRKLVNAGKFLELPTAYDAITGRLIQSVGFKSVYVGGFVTGGSTAISEPQLTMNEQIGVASRVANGLNIPVVMDAGAGWGDNQRTLAVANRRDEVDGPTREFRSRLGGASRLERELPIRIAGRQDVELGALVRAVRRRIVLL